MFWLFFIFSKHNPSDSTITMLDLSRAQHCTTRFMTSVGVKVALPKARSLVMHAVQNAVGQFAVLIDMFSQKTRYPVLLSTSTPPPHHHHLT